MGLTKYIQKAQFGVGFDIKHWIENQCQSSTKLVGILTVLRWIFGPNLEIITSNSGDLWRGQAQNGVNSDVKSSIWLWRLRSIALQSNGDCNQGLLHIWSKFGDPSLNGWWIIVRTSSWLTHTQTHTDRRRQRQYPKAKPELGQTYACSSQNIRTSLVWLIQTPFVHDSEIP